METFKYVKVSIVLRCIMDIKDRILRGALEHFFRFGVRNVTMDDLARNLGVSKKTIYQCFADKNELVCSATGLQLLEQEKDLQQISDKASDPVDEILRICDYIKTVFENINPTLLYEVEKFFPEAWAIYLDHKKHCVHDMIVKNLTEGIKQGLYRSEIDVEIIAILRMEEIQLAFNPLVFQPGQFNAGTVQVQFLDHFLYGICTLKGHKLINKYRHIIEEE